jgi:hypothetical protein
VNYFCSEKRIKAVKKERRETRHKRRKKNKERKHHKRVPITKSELAFGSMITNNGRYIEGQKNQKKIH